MLRIITLNLNGIRSAWRKGLLSWAGAQNADIVCCRNSRPRMPISAMNEGPPGLHAYYRYAEKKGLQRRRPVVPSKPDRTFRCARDAEFDLEGRYLRADFGNLSVVSLYQPSGSSSEQRQEAKFRFMALIYPRLVNWRSADATSSSVATGTSPIRKSTSGTGGATARTRAFCPRSAPGSAACSTKGGWCDVYRRLHPEAPKILHLVVQSRPGLGEERRLAARLSAGDRAISGTGESAAVYKEQRFSDHAPLTIDYEYEPGRPRELNVTAPDSHALALFALIFVLGDFYNLIRSR
jgi:exodeoxyribonuclease-3